MTVYSYISSTFGLRTESMGGALCSKPMISQFSYDFIVIFFSTFRLRTESVGGALSDFLSQ